MNATPPPRPSLLSTTPPIENALTKCSKMCKFNFLSIWFGVVCLGRAQGVARQTEKGVSERERGRCTADRGGGGAGSQQAITHMKSACRHHASCGSSSGINPKMKYPLALPAWGALLVAPSLPPLLILLHPQKSAQITRNIFRRLCRLDKHFPEAPKKAEGNGDQEGDAG